MMVFNTIFFQSAKSGETGIDKQAVKFSKSNYLFADIIDVAVDLSEEEVQESSATAGNESQYLAFAFDIGKGLPSEAVEFYNSVLRIFPRMAGNAQLSHGNNNGNLKSESVILKKEDLNAFLAPLFDELSPINVAPKQDASVPVSLFEVAGTLVLEKAESANLVLALDQHGGDDRLIIINPLSKSDQKSILPGASASDEYYIVSLVPSPVAIEDTPSIADLVHGFALPFDMETVQSLSTEAGTKVLHNPYAEDPTEEEKQISELLTVFNATVSIPVYTYNIIKNTPVTDVDAALSKDWDAITTTGSSPDPKVNEILTNLKQLFSELFTQTRGSENSSAKGITTTASMVLKTQDVMTMLEGLIRSGELTLIGSEGNLGGSDLISSLRYLSFSDGGEHAKIISLQPINVSNNGESDTFRVNFYSLSGNQDVEQAVAKLKQLSVSDPDSLMQIRENIENGKNSAVPLDEKQLTQKETSETQKVTESIRQQLAALNQIAEIDEISITKSYPIVWKDQESAASSSGKVVDVDKMLSDFFASEKNMKMVFPTGKHQLTERVIIDPKDDLAGDAIKPAVDKSSNGPVLKPTTETETDLTLQAGNGVKALRFSIEGKVNIPLIQDSENTSTMGENKPAQETPTDTNPDGKVLIDSKAPVIKDGQNISVKVGKESTVLKSDADVKSIPNSSRTEITEKENMVLESDTDSGKSDIVDNAKNIVEKGVDLKSVIRNNNDADIPKNETVLEKQPVILKEEFASGLKSKDEPVVVTGSSSDKKIHVDLVTNSTSFDKAVNAPNDTKVLSVGNPDEVKIEYELQKTFSGEIKSQVKTERPDSKTLLISNIEAEEMPIIKEKVVELIAEKDSTVIVSLKKSDTVHPVILSHKQESTRIPDGVQDVNVPEEVTVDDGTLNSTDLNTVLKPTASANELITINGKTDEVQKALLEFLKLNQQSSEATGKPFRQATLFETTIVEERTSTLTLLNENRGTVIPPEAKGTLSLNDEVKADISKTVVLINETESSDRETTAEPSLLLSQKAPVHEPKVIEPKVIEPKVIEPKVIEPKVIEPKVIEPKVIEPKVIENETFITRSNEKSTDGAGHPPLQKAVALAVKIAQIIDSVVRNSDEKPIIVTADAEEYGKVIISSEKKDGYQDVEVVISNPVLKKLVSQVIGNKHDEVSDSVDVDAELKEFSIPPLIKKEGRNVFEGNEQGLHQPESEIIKKRVIPITDERTEYDDTVTFVKVKSLVHHISGNGRVDEMMYAEVAENRTIIDTKVIKNDQTDAENADSDESHTLFHHAATVKAAPDHSQPHQSNDNTRQGSAYQGQSYTSQSEFAESGSFASDLNQIAGAVKTGVKSAVPVSAEKVVRDTEVFKEVSRFIARREKDEMILRVEPENMGRVKIRLVMQQDQMRAQIEVESEAVKKMLEGNLPQLFRDAGQAGVQLGSVQISLTQQESRQTKQGNPRKRNTDKVADASFDENKELKTQKRMGYNTYEYLA